MRKVLYVYFRHFDTCVTITTRPPETDAPRGPYVVVDLWGSESRLGQRLGYVGLYGTSRDLPTHDLMPNLWDRLELALRILTRA